MLFVIITFVHLFALCYVVSNLQFCSCKSDDSFCGQERALQGRKKRGGGRWEEKKRKKISQTTGIIGPIAEQMCKGCFLGLLLYSVSLRLVFWIISSVSKLGYTFISKGY